MAHLLDISTAVPPYRVSADDTERFFSISPDPTGAYKRKLKFLTSKSGIVNRYCCIPDFKGETSELYKDQDKIPPLEVRMKLYEQKAVPLAMSALERLFRQTGASKQQVTHLIAVSCTGMMAPGLELILAQKGGLTHTEKIAFNFMGCYGGLKGLKHAATIAEAEPDACVVVVCAELCSLHYYPSEASEDIISYLLFSDGAAAAMVCGARHPLLQNNVSLRVTGKSTALIPDTSELMAWNLSSTSFRMFLSAEVVNALNKHLSPLLAPVLSGSRERIKYWAIHPGGVKIVEAVQKQLGLKAEDVSYSLDILKYFGNMSSGTILFVLKIILSKIKKDRDFGADIFACAFGPGLNVETLSLVSVNHSVSSPLTSISHETALVSEGAP